MSANQGDGPARRTLKEKLGLATLPFFKPGKMGNTSATLGYSVSNAIAMISKNRDKIPDRYWQGETLLICQEQTRLERSSDLITVFSMEGTKGEVCKIQVNADDYEDTYECGSEEFGQLVSQLRLSSHDSEKLSELYILTKDDLELPDLIHCENMEIRRDAIKKMGYEKVREHGIVLDTFDSYELLDVRYGGVDFGRYLKMEDSTSKEVYLLKVPRTRDFGTVKIPMDKATQALAWSFNKQEHNYRPEIET